MPNPLRRRRVLLAGGFVGLLDRDGADAVAAYSLRRLRRGYTGNCLLLRRSSDSAQQAFGFSSSGWLDTAAISAWLAGADGYVVTIYDQSGNGYDATQGTSGLQPLLVLSHATHNGRPALAYSATNSALSTTASALLTALSGLTDYSHACVMSTLDVTTGTRRGTFCSASSGSNTALLFNSSLLQLNSASVQTSAANNTRYCVLGAMTTSLQQLFVNGALAASNPSTRTLGTLSRVDCGVSSVATTTFYLSEAIYWATNRSATALAIQANQASAF